MDKVEREVRALLSQYFIKEIPFHTDALVSLSTVKVKTLETQMYTLVYWAKMVMLTKPYKSFSLFDVTFKRIFQKTFVRSIFLNYSFS